MQDTAGSDNHWDTFLTEQIKITALYLNHDLTRSLGDTLQSLPCLLSLPIKFPTLMGFMQFGHLTQEPD